MSVRRPVAALFSATLLAACITEPTAKPPGPGDTGNSSDAAADLRADTSPVDIGSDVDAGIDPVGEAGDPDLPPPDLPNDVDAADTADEGDAESDGGEDARTDPADTAEDSTVDPPVCAPYTPQTGLPRIRVGTGLTGFEPLEACQPVDIILGTQGGAHVWGAFRATGFDDGGQLFGIDFTLMQDGEVVASADYQDALPMVEGEYEYDSVVVLLPENIAPEDIADQPATLTVRLFREGVVDMTDSIEIVPTCCVF